MVVKWEATEAQHPALRQELTVVPHQGISTATAMVDTIESATTIAGVHTTHTTRRVIHLLHSMHHQARQHMIRHTATITAITEVKALTRPHPRHEVILRAGDRSSSKAMDRTNRSPKGMVAMLRNHHTGHRGRISMGLRNKTMTAMAVCREAAEKRYPILGETSRDWPSRHHSSYKSVSRA